MVKRFGLSPKFRNMVFGSDNEEIFVGQSFGQVQSYSDSTAYEIDKEVQRIINECYEDTKRILEEKRSTVEGLAKRLVENYKVDGPEFEAIYEAEGDLELADKILQQKKAEAKAKAEQKAKEEAEAKAKAEEEAKAKAEASKAETRPEAKPEAESASETSEEKTETSEE